MAVGAAGRLLRDRRGVAAVEFALVAGGFLMLLLGAIEIGLLWWTENGLQVTAALTARCAALDRCLVQGASTDPKTFAVSTASGWILPNAITAADVTITPASACNGASGGSGQFTVVTITSELWSGLLIGPLANAGLKATANYPCVN